MNLEDCQHIVTSAVAELAPGKEPQQQDELVDDLDFDSLKLLELALVLEDALRIAIPEDDLEKWEYFGTVESVIAYVMERTSL